MEKIDFSTNSKNINSLYSKIVRGEPDISYGVFTVDKSSTLDVTASGSGSLDDFIEKFDDGSVQFGLARVTVPGSDVYKNILLGWCPDNAPARLRLSFAPTFAEVAKIFSGYHIQITARDSDDLDVNDILSRVGAAAGARYTYHAGGASVSTLPEVPKVAFKPSAVIATPTAKNTSFKPQDANLASGLKSKPVVADSSEDDGWGDAKAIEERDWNTQPLEDVPSAYKPTKVDIKALRSQKSDTVSSQPRAPQPVVNPISVADTKKSPPIESKKEANATFLPKPKPGNGGSAVFAASKPVTPAVVQPVFGSKPSFGSKVASGPESSYSAASKSSREGVFQNHANENGLTPAQLWAQKRGKYSVEPTNDNSDVEPDLSKLSVGDRDVQPAPVACSIPEPLESPHNVVHTGGQAPVTPQRALPPRPIPVPEPESEPVREPAPFPVRNSHVEPVKEHVQVAVPSLAKDEHTEQVVEEHDDPADVPTEQEYSTTTKPTAIAQYDYEKDEYNEVSFEESDLLVEIEFVDEEWWSGTNKRTGETGVFPASFVSLNNDEEAEQDVDFAASVKSSTQVPEEPIKAQSKTAIAEYDYDKEEDNEIGFSEGDLIVDIEFVDEDWWSGKHSVTGEVGVFPGNFVALQS